MGLYSGRHTAVNLEWATTTFMAFVRTYCRLKVEGLEHIPTSGAFILAANHSSHADTAVIFSTLPRIMRRRVLAAAARDYFFDGGFKQFVSRTLFNTIPVARDASAGEDPLRHVLRALREDYGVLLYPEGTRSATGKIGPFRGGIGRLTAEFPGIPIIPTALKGTADVLPKSAMVPRPRRVVVRYGEPICHLRADRNDLKSWRAVAQDVRNAVVALWEKG